jgi:hypothetical protein
VTDRIRAIAKRMAARLGRDVRVSPVTLSLVITALRQYADPSRLPTACALNRAREATMVILRYRASRRENP